MLLTDQDRTAYLKNVYRVLKPGAPMLFFRESYKRMAMRGMFLATISILKSSEAAMISL